MLPGGLSDLGLPGSGSPAASSGLKMECWPDVWTELHTRILTVSPWGLMSKRRWGESGEGPCAPSLGSTSPGSLPGWVVCTGSPPSSCSKLPVGCAVPGLRWLLCRVGGSCPGRGGCRW